MPHVLLRRAVMAAALAPVLAFALPAAPFLSPLTPALAAEGAPQPKIPGEALEIATSKGVMTFEVEVARTDEQRTIGLMFRKSVGEQAGMLFDFKVDQPVYMWMKNTLVPLDMLFIRADGSIARIAAMTTPLSTETISSGEPVRAVLEIAGGAAKKLGIKPGDRVAHPVFSGK
ncbi:DUF192 domain-containing protein [Xanthobacter autotrophicus DSM 431]|uniref:DUF192 domain-containing protein n=1 Tax=Xanthobacter nonsaccharivorans TaxID=3119912 RepID=UPI0037272817